MTLNHALEASCGGLADHKVAGESPGEVGRGKFESPNLPRCRV